MRKSIVDFIDSSMKSITEDTIGKAFVKCGFKNQSTYPDEMVNTKLQAILDVKSEEIENDP